MAGRRVTSKTKIFRVEVVLDGVQPAVRRAVEVPGEVSLAVLHEIVQRAMGWQNAHLHEFEIDGTVYGPPDPDGEFEVGDESAATLVRLVAAGDRLGYLYDFGDGWEHTLAVTAVEAPQPGVRYPRCVDGEGACPPEDVGGSTGYAEFCDAVADPAHPDHDDQVEWWGSDRFDPGRFDLDAADRALARLAWAPLAASSARP